MKKIIIFFIAFTTVVTSFVLFTKLACADNKDKEPNETDFYIESKAAESGLCDERDDICTEKNNTIQPETKEIICTQEMFTTESRQVVWEKTEQETETEQETSQETAVKQETETVPVHKHTVVIDNEIKPTCVSSGVTEGQHCSSCHKVLVEQKSIPALGHKITTKPSVKPTCTEAGVTEGTYCSVCGKTITEQVVVPALGHNIVIDKKIEATCTADGLSEGKHCSVCNKVLQERTVIKATGHTMIVKKRIAPSCVSTGITEKKYCLKCGLVVYGGDVIEKVGHQWSEWKEGNNYEEERSCVVCGKKETRKQMYNPANHTPIETYKGQTKAVQDIIKKYHATVKSWDGTPMLTIQCGDITRAEVFQIRAYIFLHYGINKYEVPSIEYDFYQEVENELLLESSILLRDIEGIRSIESNREKVIQEIDRILRTFKDGDDYYIVQQIINYLADNITYLSGTIGAETALFKHKAVCAGYAVTFKLMCERAGIECDYIEGLSGVGTANEGKHAWNAIRIGGKTYYCDVTWYDGTKNKKWIMSSTPFHYTLSVNSFSYGY